MPHVFRFIGRAEDRNRDTLVHGIAEHVFPAVIELLRSHGLAMSAAELRGYVRVRAFDTVRAEVARVAAEQHLTQMRETELVAAVLERTVHLLIREHVAPPTATVPIAHIRPRAAA